VVFGGGCSELEKPSLTVQIDAPDNAKIDVEVEGPGDFHKVINTTTTFSDVTFGQYRVQLVEARKRITRPVIDDYFVGTVDNPTPRVAEPTTVRITFEREPGSGHVWVPVAKADKVVAFSAGAFALMAAPTSARAPPPGSGPDAVAFRLGDLWVAFRDAGQVAMYEALEIGRPGTTPAPAKTIPNLGRPSSLAFDKSGDIFVAEASKRTIARFTSLASKPALGSFVRVEGSPSSIAFDAAGTMFVATTDPAAVRIFTVPATASERPTLRGSIVGAHTGLVAPSGLAFGTDGGLWVTNGDKAPAVRFDPYSLADAIGDVDARPSATLTPPAGESLNGLAFDKEGQGWFTAVSGQEHDLRCGTAMQTDAPTIGPAVSLGLDKAQAFGTAMFAFNPPPVGSPIRR
jgi:streptogramin lyase